VLFNETILKELPSDFYYKKVFLELIEEYISTDKMLFMDGAGVATIANEDLGNWDEGIWYSNYSHWASYYSTSYYSSAKPASQYSGNEEYAEYWQNKESSGFNICQSEWCRETLMWDDEVKSGYCDNCLSMKGESCKKISTRHGVTGHNFVG